MGIAVFHSLSGRVAWQGTQEENAKVTPNPRAETDGACTSECTVAELARDNKITALVLDPLGPLGKPG